MAVRNLVFCRAGESSLHPGWIGDPATRSYDVWLDCYCDPAVWSGAAAKVTDGRGSTKWPRIAALLAENPAVFDAYDAVWFPDDDLVIDARATDRFFAVFHQARLALAQPGLAEGSFFSHELTIAHSTFSLRYTNFVEVMAPAFSREALRRCASTFGLSKSGWGLDYAWPRVLGDPQDTIAIVDATPMLHMRPVGGGGSYVWPEAEAEARDLAARYGTAVPYPYRQYGGKKRGRGGGPGRRVGTGLLFLARLGLGAPKSQRWRARYWEIMRSTM